MPIRQQVPNVMSGYAGIGRSIGGAVQSAANTMAPAVGAYALQKHDKSLYEKEYGEMRKTLMDPNNQEEFGIGPKQAKAMAWKLKKRENESYGDWEKRSKSVFSNLKMWEASKAKETGIPLINPFSKKFAEELRVVEKNLEIEGLVAEASEKKPKTTEEFQQGIQSRITGTGMSATDLAGSAAYQTALGGLQSKKKKTETENGPTGGSVTISSLDDRIKNMEKERNDLLAVAADWGTDKDKLPDIEKEINKYNKAIKSASTMRDRMYEEAGISVPAVEEDAVTPFVNAITERIRAAAEKNRSKGYDVAGEYLDPVLEFAESRGVYYQSPDRLRYLLEKYPLEDIIAGIMQQKPNKPIGASKPGNEMKIDAVTGAQPAMQKKRDIAHDTARPYY